MPNRDIQVGRFDQLVHELELTLALMREDLVGKFIPDGVTFGSPQEVLGRPASSGGVNVAAAARASNTGGR